MSEHTPGLLELEEVVSDSGHIKHLCPVDSDGMSLLTVVEHEGVKFAAVYSDDDARRLVACWNACEGLDTVDLEMDNVMFVAALKERQSLRAVNAEMLKALSFYADKTRYRGPNQSLDAPDAWSEKVGLKAYRLDVTRDGGVIARAAIASARKLKGEEA